MINIDTLVAQLTEAAEALVGQYDELADVPLAALIEQTSIVSREITLEQVAGMLAQLADRGEIGPNDGSEWTKEAGANLIAVLLLLTPPPPDIVRELFTKEQVNSLLQMASEGKLEGIA